MRAVSKIQPAGINIGVTVKTRIQEHPFSGFRQIGAYFSCNYKAFNSKYSCCTFSILTSIYREILVQYHNKATDTFCSIKLKREEFLYIRTIFNFQAECVLIYMLLFLPNFSLGILNSHVLVCGFLLWFLNGLSGRNSNTETPNTPRSFTN